MRKPHKHAELIKAWADGVKIQKMNKDGTWSDHQDDWPWFNDWIYRIKPEPKPDTISVGIIEWDGTLICGEAQYNTLFRVSERNERDNIKLTFDGETGKLKSAEVL